MTAHPYDRPKRVIDLVISVTALIVTAPVQGIVALLVRRNLGSPILFRQERPGKNEQIFELVKFRTMLEPNEDAGLVTNEQRMTRFGATLRSTSLDELPTLWNVVKGDMSLVGPRPLLVKYIDRYTPAQRRRHEVKPGVTGLAQARGRNGLDWESKLDLDTEYVNRRSFRMDLSIIGQTLTTLIKCEGIRHPGSVSMPEFLGTSSKSNQ